MFRQASNDLMYKLTNKNYIRKMIIENMFYCEAEESVFIFKQKD
jgi:hypothetical protein